MLLKHWKQNGDTLSYKDFLQSFVDRKKLFHSEELLAGVIENKTTASTQEPTTITASATTSSDSNDIGELRKRRTKRKNFPDRSPARTLEETQLPTVQELLYDV
jgi:hypothetical protein